MPSGETITGEEYRARYLDGSMVRLEGSALGCLIAALLFGKVTARIAAAAEVELSLTLSPLTLGLIAAALLFALNFVAALLLCILNSSSERLAKQIDEVYENAVITCQVSNLTGTQTEDLSLPQWVVHLFMGNAGVPGTEHINFSNDAVAAAFRAYLSAVYAKTAIRATHLGTNVTLVG